MQPVFQIVESSVLFKRIKLKTDHKTWIWRTFCVIMTALIAMGVPKFGLFINLIGSIACTMLAFIVPVKIYNKVHKGQMSRQKQWLHRAIYIVGGIGGSLSFYVSLINIALAFGKGTTDEELETEG